jgi:FixJ family two-component response regulator
LKPTVLVVDDDAAVCRSIGCLLEAFDFRVKLYQSGKEFLEQFINNGDLACLLLDMRMPGMSALEVQQELRERGEVVPTIVITGHWDADSVSRALEVGAIAVLEKPFEPEDLIEHINEALGIA